MTLTAIDMTSFKRFARWRMPLSPLTVLTGMNGGGKTTILHAILLLRQAASGHPPADFVQLNGPFGLELGEAQDVLHFDADPAEGSTLVLSDAAGHEHAWRFTTSDERSLHLRVHSRPDRPPECLSLEARRFTYLSADRLGPRDSLGASSVHVDDLNVGCRGEFVAQVLAVLDRQRVAPARLHPSTGERGSVETLRQQVEWWLSDIARPVQIDAEWVPGSGVTLLRYRSPSAPVERLRPANMGFGVTYALPVVTAALLAPEASLLLVENPEAHLHPAGQSAMGAFLARVVASGVQVVLETHSDHVLNGIRRAVAADAVLPRDSVRIHFFGSSDPRPGDLPISIGERGELSGWPEGFFDQLDRDLRVLSHVRRRRT